MKGFLVLLLSLFSINSYSSNNNNFIVSAHTNSGCYINSESFHFGNIGIQDLKGADFYNKKLSINNDLQINCSPNTIVQISQLGQNSNRSGWDYNYLKSEYNDLIPYMLLVYPEIKPQYNIIQLPYQNRLGNENGESGKYNLILKINSGDLISIPSSVALVDTNQLFKLKAANFSDLMTYSISF